MRYKTVRRLHLGLTLVMALPLLVLSLTGAVLAFGKEVDRLVEPDVYTVAPRPGGVLPVDTLVERLARQRPDLTLWSMGVPDAADAAWTAWLAHGAGILVFDPYDGTVLSHRTPRESVNGFLTGVHRYWMAPEAARPVARNIISSVALILIVQFCIGLRLFLIPPRPLKRLAVKRGRLFVLRLHQATGLGTGLVLMVIAFTGLSIFWHGPTKALFEAAGAEIIEPPRPALDGLPAVGSIDDALALAREERPGERLLHFRVPSGPGEALVAAFSDGMLSLPVRVWVGDAPLRVLATHNPRGDGLGAWIWHNRYHIHMGDFAGLPIKLLWALLALLPTGFMVTGGILHLRRRRRRQAADRAVAAQAAAQAAASAED